MFPAGPAPIFDLAALRELTDGDPAIERQILGLFCETAESCLSVLERLSQEDKEEEWQQVVHALRGAASNIRAEKLVELCTKYEYMPLSSRRIGALAELRYAYDVLRPLLIAV